MSFCYHYSQNVSHKTQQVKTVTRAKQDAQQSETFKLSETLEEMGADRPEILV